MLNYNEMVKCSNEMRNETQIKKQKMEIDKYKYFVEYIKKIIEITFEDEKDSIISYMKETPNQSLILGWDNVLGLRRSGIRISLVCGSIQMSSLIIHYYDCNFVLDLTQDLTDEELLMFFGEGYGYGYVTFTNMFVPNYRIDDLHNKYIDKYSSVVWRISDLLNRVIYKCFIKYFKSLKIKDYESFTNSEYSLTFTDDRRRELDIEVRNYYDVYKKQVEELSKQFDVSIDGLN